MSGCPCASPPHEDRFAGLEAGAVAAARGFQKDLGLVFWGQGMGMLVKVAKTHDLPEGTMVAVMVGDTEVLLARVQGQYYSISNVCSHADAWLDQGDLRPATWEVQ